jgi:hypothetical protein
MTVRATPIEYLRTTPVDAPVAACIAFWTNGYYNGARCLI